LRRIGAEQAVFQRRAVEPADNRVHLLCIGGVDKSEALGLLRFGIADHFYCVRNKIFGGEPSSDIVSGHPNRQIAQKNGKTHSMVVFDSMAGVLLRRYSEALICYHILPNPQMESSKF
jgi:hypothetical protein